MFMNTPYMMPCYSGDLRQYKTLEQAITLIKQAIPDEKEDEMFYNCLISMAPAEDEKNIIESIRNDEIKHNKMFREIYKFFTGQDFPEVTDVEVKKPKSYVSGLKQALFGELGAVEKYRNIRAGIPNRYYRDMVFEILTDEMKHADKYNYLLSKSMHEHVRDEMMRTDSVAVMPKMSFNASDASKIAKQLGIDFSKEKFDIQQFTMGLNVELEHGLRDLQTNVTGNDPILTGKIALAHLREFPDYYTRLARLEEEAKAYWQMRSICPFSNEIIKNVF